MRAAENAAKQVLLTDLDGDTLHEECGIFGVWAPDRDVARLTYFGLRALQHRGQESAGIAAGDGGTVMVRKDLGLVSNVFSNADIDALSGQLAVGHVRYGTAGAKSWESSQPHLSTIGDVIVALAHNGTLVNTDELRRQLIELGVDFNSSSDSEVAAKLIGYFTQETHHLRAHQRGGAIRVPRSPWHPSAGAGPSDERRGRCRRRRCRCRRRVAERRRLR